MVICMRVDCAPIIKFNFRTYMPLLRYARENAFFAKTMFFWSIISFDLFSDKISENSLNLLMTLIFLLLRKCQYLFYPRCIYTF